MSRKPLLKLLEPDIVVPGTILQLSADTLNQHGIKGIILDVDDTLVPLSDSVLSPDVSTWLDHLQPHFQIWLVSNNLSKTRISQIANSAQLPHIHGAGKPSRRALRHAVDQMQLSLSEVAIIGDRLLTDILAGNRLGLLTILVSPLQSGSSRSR